jgi:hypothetical protein
LLRRLVPRGRRFFFVLALAFSGGNPAAFAPPVRFALRFARAFRFFPLRSGRKAADGAAAGHLLTIKKCKLLFLNICSFFLRKV